MLNLVKPVVTFGILRMGSGHHCKTLTMEGRTTKWLPCLGIYKMLSHFRPNIFLCWGQIFLNVPWILWKFRINSFLGGKVFWGKVSFQMNMKSEFPDEHGERSRSKKGQTQIFKRLPLLCLVSHVKIERYVEEESAG